MMIVILIMLWLISIGLNIILFCGMIKAEGQLHDSCVELEAQKTKHNALLNNCAFRCQRCKRIIKKKNVHDADGDIVCPTCYNKYMKLKQGV